MLAWTLCGGGWRLRFSACLSKTGLDIWLRSGVQSLAVRYCGIVTLRDNSRSIERRSGLTGNVPGSDMRGQCREAARPSLDKPPGGRGSGGQRTARANTRSTHQPRRAASPPAHTRKPSEQKDHILFKPERAFASAEPRGSAGERGQRCREGGFAGSGPTGTRTAK